MGRGSPQHQNEIARVASQRRADGMKVINVQERISEHVAILGDLIFCVAHRLGKVTHAQARGKWLHFDGVLTWADDEGFEAFRTRREAQGFRFIATEGKVPDLLSFDPKNGEWAAIEVLLHNAGEGRTTGENQKRLYYRMWDRVVIVNVIRKADGAPT